MKKEIILTCLLFIGALHFGIAQTSVSVQVLIPSGQEFSRGQEHQLQIAISGIDGSAQTIKSHITNITTVPSVLYFNIIIQPDQTVGYCDLRFEASSKKDFELMMKDIFCKLEAKSIRINDAVFENCQQITIP